MSWYFYFLEVGVKMKKGPFFEIAVIVAGIDEEYQREVINGIISFSKESQINLSVFTSYGGVIKSSRYDKGEYNIYSLINYDKFDGLILLTNTICTDDERNRIISEVRASGLPAAVLDCDDYPEFFNIRIDNKSAMEEIVRHVITVHGAKTINYISGPLSNPEASDRYDTFMKVTGEFGINVSDDQIYFGLFRSIDGKKAITQFVESGRKLPDAIICANDNMALSAVAELESLGYSVPEHIIVTGFDNTYNARHHYPALTTVARPLFESGYRACETVFSAINGESPDKVITLDSSAVFTQSCGCSNEFTENVPKYKKGVYHSINSTRDDISLLERLTPELAEADGADDNFRILGKFIPELQCERCCICLCSGWEGKRRHLWDPRSDDSFQINGYTPLMSAPLIWNKGIISKVELFNSSDMYPVPNRSGGNVSFFMPLHFRQRCLGYFIITNSDFTGRSLMCHSLMMTISNSIENVRKIKNLTGAIDELNKLYVMDPLCNIYNRNGFRRTAEEMYSECLKIRGNIIISFIDMDGLKQINDNYGHQEGDNALRCLADIITECCNDDQICARFGGDEFILFGVNACEDDVQRLEKDFADKIEQTNHHIRKPYRIEASIGTIVTKLNGKQDLFDLITKADELMYENKKRKKNSRYLRR